jgi:prepilin peptidase CpaA
MGIYSLLTVAPALALLVWAAVEDIKHRRIPNWLTFSLMLSGIAQSFTHGALVTPSMSMAGFAVGFALPFALFVLGAVGGADVKLLAGLGAWFGPYIALRLFLVEGVVGAVIVLVQALMQGRMRTLLRNSAVVAINLVHVNDVGLEHTKLTGQSCRSVDRPLPYAVPVLVAMIILLAFA